MPNPLDWEELETLIPPCIPSKKIAVGISGGADSMALALLLKDWAAQRGYLLEGLTVNHGLRKEAAEEAFQVQKWLKQWKVPHHILCWQPPSKLKNLQEEARTARYNLLTTWCKNHEVPSLFLAHHLEDQAETFLLNLCRGSGVDGLTAMPTVRLQEGVQLIRPLLGISKSRLLDTLKHHQQEWVEDPSNQNDQFARVRMRQLQKLLAEEGLTPHKIYQTTQRLGRAREFLQEETKNFIQKAAILHPAGYWTLNQQEFCAASSEIAMRTLQHILQQCGGHSHPLRERTIARLFENMIHWPTPNHRTTSGRCIIFAQKDCFYFQREARSSYSTALPFTVTPQLPEGLILKVLGKEGLKQIVTYLPDFKKKAALPPRLYPGFPAIWENDKVVSVPHLNFSLPNYPVFQLLP